MNGYKGSELFYRLIQGVLLMFYKVAFRFRRTGTQLVPKASDPRGVILAPNHASFLDPPILGISLHRRVTFLAKEYLFKNFFVGTVLRGIGAYPIKSEKDDFRSIRDLIRILKDGKCVVVFPEGTRSENGQMKEPEGGIGFLAVKSGAYVVPVFICGSYEAFPKGAKMFRPHNIGEHFGEPFVPAEEKSLLQDQDPYAAVARDIMARIRNIKDAVEAGK